MSTTTAPTSARGRRRRARATAAPEVVVEDATGAAVLGIIPTEDALGRTHGGVRGALGRAAESFRQLRTNLRFVDVDNEPRKIVVTSALAGEGKSTVSANIARRVAQAGTPVLLIDADDGKLVHVTRK